METVKLHITIDIKADDVYDTELTVAAWNQMTDTERARIVYDVWLDMTQANNGGVTVVTPGAVEC